MKELSGVFKNYLEKKKILAKSKSLKIKHQYQDIALELAKEFGLKGKDRARLFGFIKQKLAKGQWGKVKEVREYMAGKGIKSLRYFMSCFKKNERK